MSEQKQRGYLRGVRGILVTPLNLDGSMPTSPETYWVDTAQEVALSVEIVEGESADLRGGDRQLVRIEEESTIVGVDLTFRDARFDAELTEIIAGGSLVMGETIVEGETGQVVLGWEAPKVADQTDRTPFQAEVYVQSFNAEGGREAYLVYQFRYCKGYVPEITHGDRAWGTPEFEIMARENPATAKSTYQKSFVASLPAEASA